MNDAIQRYGFVGLPQSHLVHQVACPCVLVHNEQDVANVHADGALKFVLEKDVSRHGLPVAVKGHADQLALPLIKGEPELPPVMSLSVIKPTGNLPLASA